MLKNWLIIYDIRDPRRLRRVSKVMEKYGVRVQKSVFESKCSEKAIKKMRREALREIEEEDSVITFNLCPRCWQKRRQIGVCEDGPNDDERYRVL